MVFVEAQGKGKAAEQLRADAGDMAVIGLHVVLKSGHVWPDVRPQQRAASLGAGVIEADIVGFLQIVAAAGELLLAHGDIPAVVFRQADVARHLGLDWQREIGLRPREEPVEQGAVQLCALDIEKAGIGAGAVKVARDGEPVFQVLAVEAGYVDDGKGVMVWHVGSEHSRAKS